MVSNINECVEISQCWKKTTASRNRWSSYFLKDDLIIKKDYVSLLFPCYSGKPERQYDGKLCVCVYTKIHCYILKVGTRISLKPYTETIFLSCFVEVAALSSSPTHCCEKCNHDLIIIPLSFCSTVMFHAYMVSNKFSMHIIKTG